MENRTYKYFKGRPLYAFGYGLSYTEFAYSNARVNEKQLTITIENTGNRGGEEVVQVYVRQVGTVYPKPFKELLGFNRISLEPGESGELTIELEWNILNYWDPETQRFELEKGTYQFLIGPSSKDTRIIHEMTI
jgi:beta-glucosidase